MNRRTWLATVASLVGAGCVTSSGRAGDTTETITRSATPQNIGNIDNRTVDDEGATQTTEIAAVNAPVTVVLTVEIRSGQSRTVTCTITHTEEPACRYATPECGMPSVETTALDATINVGQGDHHTFEPVTMETEADGDSVDIYEFEVETADGVSTTLAGLEPGAAQVVGRSNAREYPWRVAARPYQVLASVGDDDVDLFVRTTP